MCARGDYQLGEEDVLHSKEVRSAGEEVESTREQTESAGEEAESPDEVAEISGQKPGFDEAISVPLVSATTPRKPLYGNFQNQQQRDDFVYQRRQEGLSWREIKQRGGFTQAEATIRVWHHILSTPPSQRKISAPGDQTWQPRT